MVRALSPIVVLGIARNGTTWLCNSFVGEKDCAVLHHPLHHGSHETNELHHYLYWDDITESDKYIDFLGRYSTLDDFKLASGEIEYHLRNRPSDFFEFFCDMMDRYASMSDCSRWVIKLDTLFYLFPKYRNQFFDHLSYRYGKICVIAAQRELKTAANSYLNMEGKYNSLRRSRLLRPFALWLYVCRYIVYRAEIREIIKRHNGLLVDYEDMVNEPVAVETAIAAHCGLNSFSLSSPYKKNTSFVRKERSRLGTAEEKALVLSASVVQLMRGFVAFGLRQIEKRRKEPIMYRRLLKHEFFAEELRSEFVEHNAHALVDYMDEVTSRR